MGPHLQSGKLVRIREKTGHGERVCAKRQIELGKTTVVFTGKFGKQ